MSKETINAKANSLVGGITVTFVNYSSQNCWRRTEK
jgi:hypothetical protein